MPDGNGVLDVNVDDEVRDVTSPPTPPTHVGEGFVTAVSGAAVIAVAAAVVPAAVTTSAVIVSVAAVVAAAVVTATAAVMASAGVEGGVEDVSRWAIRV